MWDDYFPGLEYCLVCFDVQQNVFWTSDKAGIQRSKSGAEHGDRGKSQMENKERDPALLMSPLCCSNEGTAVS